MACRRRAGLPTSRSPLPGPDSTTAVGERVDRGADGVGDVDAVVRTPQRAPKPDVKRPWAGRDEDLVPRRAPRRRRGPGWRDARRPCGDLRADARRPRPRSARPPRRPGGRPSPAGRSRWPRRPLDRRAGPRSVVVPRSAARASSAVVRLAAARRARRGRAPRSRAPGSDDGAGGHAAATGHARRGGAGAGHGRGRCPGAVAGGRAVGVVSLGAAGELWRAKTSLLDRGPSRRRGPGNPLGRSGSFRCRS